MYIKIAAIFVIYTKKEYKIPPHREKNITIFFEPKRAFPTNAVLNLIKSIKNRQPHLKFTIQIVCDIEVAINMVGD